MEVRDAPGWPGFSGEGAGSFAGKLKARVENCEIKKIPASDQNSPSRPARREVLRSKFITRSISSPLKCLGSITAFPAGQSAAKQPRCAAERRDWDRGAATPEALSPHARTRRLPRAQGLALPPAFPAQHRHPPVGYRASPPTNSPLLRARRDCCHARAHRPGPAAHRSEERRVGKECRSRCAAEQEKKQHLH